MPRIAPSYRWIRANFTPNFQSLWQCFMRYRQICFWQNSGRRAGGVSAQAISQYRHRLDGTLVTCSYCYCRRSTANSISAYRPLYRQLYLRLPLALSPLGLSQHFPPSS